MHSFAPFWNRIPKTGKTVGRKEPGPDNHRKNDQEKLISSRNQLLSTTSARALKSVYEYETIC